MVFKGCCLCLVSVSLRALNHMVQAKQSHLEGVLKWNGFVLLS